MPALCLGKAILRCLSDLWIFYCRLTRDEPSGRADGIIGGTNMLRTCIVAVSATILVLCSGGCAAGSIVSAAIGVPFEAARLTQKLTFAQIETSVKVAQGGIAVAKGGVELAGGTVDLIDRTGRAIHAHKMRKLEHQRVASAQ